MTEPRPLVLASTSPWRAELLSRLGLPFEQADPDVDERPFKERGLSPRALVLELARAKASALAQRYPDALIVGADQVVHLDGELFDKPGTVEGAVTQLLRLQGREHELITGVALLDSASGGVTTGLDAHRVRLRELSEDAIRRYVHRDLPLNCAGSYKLEAAGITLFDAVEGKDYTGVVGLPLMLVTRLLLGRGVDPLG